MNMFEKASRLKLRFETSAGNITVEDLWGLRLTGQVSLDAIAKHLNAALKADEEESFVVKKSTQNEVLSLKFEIVKHVIKVRLEEQEAKKAEVANKAKKERIMQILSSKEDEALMNKSAEELQALLNSM